MKRKVSEGNAKVRQKPTQCTSSMPAPRSGFQHGLRRIFSC
jgi:hypothetical protein